jgi:hypothetical protein
MRGLGLRRGGRWRSRCEWERKKKLLLEDLAIVEERNVFGKIWMSSACGGYGDEDPQTERTERIRHDEEPRRFCMATITT